VPREFTYKQNFPNPFNRRQIYDLAIADLRFVTLKVFDFWGRKSRRLVNNTLPAGSYHVTFDARSLSSGVYFLSAISGRDGPGKKNDPGKNK